MSVRRIRELVAGTENIPEVVKTTGVDNVVNVVPDGGNYIPQSPSQVGVDATKF